MGVDHRHQCDLLVNLNCVCVCLLIVCFMRGFEKGKVRTVIELGVLESGKRKRVG
jgi:hypothetical protein